MQILRFVCSIFLIFTVGINNIYSQSETVELDKKRRFDNFFYEAMHARTQGEYDSAFDLLKYCHGIDSTNSATLYELGNYYNSIGKKQEAYKLYKSAVAYDPINYYYGTAYATLSLELKEYSVAIKQYTTLVKDNAEKTNLYLYLSEAYRLNNEPLKAIDALDQLEQFVGLNEKLSLQKFQLYTTLKQEQKAFAEIQKYIDKYPTEIQYYVLLGDLYLQADKNDLALLTYSKAKSIDPDDPYLISSMAGYYEKVGRKEQAEEELKIALISPKMDIETKLAILAQYVTTLQQRNKDTKDTNALFDTLMVQHPQEPSLNMMYGNLLLIQNRKDDAREQYRIFAEANPSNPIGWEQMLTTAFPDSLDMTIEICKTAISHIADQPQFYFYLGIAQSIQKDYQPALEALQAGLKYVDERNLRLVSDFYGQIGDLYYHTERIDSAYVSYEQALKVNPNNLGVLNNYSYFLTVQKKDLDKAEKMSSITIKAEPLNPTYLDTYGWVLFEQGAYLMAKIYIENAIKYSEDDKEEISAEVYEHYGDVLYKTGEKEKAVEYWLKAKKMGETKSKTLDEKIEKKEYIDK